MMETVKLGRSDLVVSRIAMGCYPLGGHGWGCVDDDESVRAVRKAVDLGVNFFDTADCYGLGHSELILAEALGGRRKEVVIASKFGVRWDSSGKTCKDASPAYLRQALEGSLKRLGLDCIALYYLHWPDGVTPIVETMAELERCRKEGKIRWIGLSNVSADQVRQALTAGDVQALQVQYSLLDRSAAEALLPVAQEYEIPLVTWGSLAQGILTGKFTEESRFSDADRRSQSRQFQGDRFIRNLKVAQYLRIKAKQLGVTCAQLAIRWLLDSPSVGCVLFGAKHSRQVEENIAATGWRLCERDYEELARAAIQALPGAEGMRPPRDDKTRSWHN